MGSYTPLFKINDVIKHKVHQNEAKIVDNACTLEFFGHQIPAYRLIAQSHEDAVLPRNQVEEDWTLAKQIDATFNTDIVDKGWRLSSVEPPQAGFIVKRWNNGALWVGFFNGTAKDADCDFWYPLPQF